MKQNGYQIVSELFGFGKPDPAQHLEFAAKFIYENYESTLQEYNQQDNAHYSLVEADDFSSRKRIIEQIAKKTARESNSSYKIYQYHGLLIALYYSRASRTYDYFSYWIVDTDVGLATAIIVQFKYINNRLVLPTSGKFNIKTYKMKF